MNKVALIFLLVIGILGTLWQFTNFRGDVKEISLKQSTLEDIDSLRTEWNFDIFRFVAHEDGPTIWVTDVYIGSELQPGFSLNGYFESSQFQDIKADGTKYLEVILLQGKLANSRLFKYVDGRLLQVPISTERPDGFIGVVGSSAPEYKDIDGDGTREMFVYHRHYPPAYKRAVEVYQFRNEAFWKWKEYEENTQELFL